MYYYKVYTPFLFVICGKTILDLKSNLFDVLVARDGVVTSVKRLFTKIMLFLATRTPNGFE